MDTITLPTPPATTLDADRSAAVTGVNQRIRGDIEGLRALAVLAVLVHHAFPAALPGGFVGVDVFFVISGYLIGRHLLQDIAADRFCVRRFYARRARRLFPALIVVLVAVLSAGWLVLSAPELSALGKHIAATAIFSNNILLWTESGYFDVAAIDKPLLHLWSLGVEEQFYLLVPAILWLSARRGEGSVRWVAWLGGLSLLATILLCSFEFSASFYLLHTRFWELACGVVLAQAQLRQFPAVRPPEQVNSASKRDLRALLAFSAALILSAVLLISVSENQHDWNTALTRSGILLILVLGIATGALADLHTHREAWNRLIVRIKRNLARVTAATSIAGVVLVCLSFGALRSANWPGAVTVFPVLGTLLVIAAGPAALPNRLLAIKPMLFVGGISYPLYLWHWPAIVVWRLLDPYGSSIDSAIPLITSFALAWLTKIFVEDPIRFGRTGPVASPQLSTANVRPPSRLIPLWPVASVLMASGALGLWLTASHGIPSRFPPRLQAVAEWSEVNPDVNWRVLRCYFYLRASIDFADECTPAKRPGVPLVLLWGDSHAAHLYPGLAANQRSLGFDIVQWTAAGCPPTISAVAWESVSCPRLRATALKRLGEIKPDLVVLGGAWERYHELGLTQAEILQLLDETVRFLRAKRIDRIAIFGPGPLWRTTLAGDVLRNMVWTRSDRIPERLGKIPDAVWELDAALAAQAASEHVQYVSILGIFCNKSGCLTVRDDSLSRPDFLYRDQDHLTVSGSLALIDQSKRQLFDRN